MCTIIWNSLKEIKMKSWKVIGGSVVKNLPASAGDARDTNSIPQSGRSPEEGHGNPLQHPCPENPMDREAWQATIRGVSKI